MATKKKASSKKATLPKSVAVPPGSGRKDKATKAAKMCPVDRKTFAASAEQVLVDVGGQCLGADPREFKTGSIGWFANGKITVMVDGHPVVAQAQLTLTAINSKNLPRQ